jgi:tripartite-type tricarboxylate transporter receptor subunit TctC
MNRSVLARIFTGLALGLVATTSAFAAKPWPSKPLRLIVPFGPGGVADVTARIVAQGLAEKFGQPVVVENYPSAGGITGSAQFVRSDADGYTIFLVSNQNAVSPSLFKSLPYDPVKQFTMVSMIGSFDLIMAVDQNSPYKSVADVVAAAKKSPDHFNIGTIGVGSTQNLAAELFRSSAGLTVPTVPFKSTGEVISALKGNSVQVMFETVPAVIGQIKANSMRILGVAAAKRNPLIPNVPTIAEAGVPGYIAVSWNGIAVPTGTPPEIVAKLNQTIHAVVADPETNKKLVELGNIPQTDTPQEFQKFLISEIDKWRKVIEVAKIEKQ